MSIIVTLVLASIVLFGLMPAHIENKGNVFLDRAFTDSIKGIGIIVVFFDHISGYIKSASVAMNRPDSFFFYIISLLTTLFVAAFLFFSGYGVTESISKKGVDYVSGIPKRRVLSTLFNFDIAITVFIAVIFLIGEGKSLSIKQCLLSLIAWDSVGNSNWYIFCILCCYFFSYIAALISRSANGYLMILLLLIVSYIVIISSVKDSYWYNTILAYGFGAAVSCFKQFFIRLINKHYVRAFVAGLFIFCLLFYLSTNNAYLYNLTSVAFCLLLVFVSNKLSVNSKVLQWCGNHLFQIYIYQRLPMIVFATLAPAFITDNLWIFIISCLAITLLLASFIPKVSFK